MGKIYNATPPEAIHITITSASYETNYSPALDGEVGHAAWTFVADYAVKFDENVGDGGDWVADDDHPVLPPVRFKLSDGYIETISELLPEGYGVAVHPYGGVVACLPKLAFDAMGDTAYIDFAAELVIDGATYNYIAEYLTTAEDSSLLPGQAGVGVLTLVPLE